MEPGVLLSGVLIGYESKPKKDGSGVSTVALVACGMESYRITIKPEGVQALYEKGNFQDVLFRARPFCSNNRLYWTDGELIGEGG